MRFIIHWFAWVGGLVTFFGTAFGVQWLVNNWDQELSLGIVVGKILIFIMYAALISVAAAMTSSLEKDK